MRTMYDAVTPANIPAGAQMVAGYVDGRYAWKAADWARFPAAVKVRIAVFPATNDGHVIDCENGDATPAQCPGWVRMRRTAGVEPTVYCSLFAWPVVRAAFVAAKVREPSYWVAAYPGNGPHLYPGAVAHQWDSPGPVDISVVADYWPGVDPTPAPAKPPPAPKPPAPLPKPLPTGGLTVTILDFSLVSTGASTWLSSAGVIPLQRLLQIRADGLGGPSTRASLVGYQRAHGLAPDGVFGPVTANTMLSGR